MGNLTSVPADGTNVTLDGLGGYYRPAVLKKNELDTKTAWLGASALDQANRMEQEMQLHATTKEQAMMAVGGPTMTKKIGFGGSVRASGPRPGTNQMARRPLPPQARPGTSQALLRSSAPAPLVGTNLGALVQSVGLDALGRPSTVPTSLTRSLDASALGKPTTPGGNPYTMAKTPLGPAGRKQKAAAIAAARAARVAEEQFKANHWRSRVEGAKRRLYHYLVAYMAWMSVLKKKRTGYADPLPVDVLPMFLGNVLMDLTDQAGQHLASCGGLVEENDEAKAKLTALTGGRLWLSRVRGKQTDKDATADTSAAVSSSTPAAGLPPALAPAAPNPDSGTSSALPKSPLGKATRGGARALVGAGAGAGALNQLVPSTPARSSRTSVGRLSSSQVPGASSVPARESMLSPYMKPRASKVTATGYAREVEAVRRITTLYITRTALKRKDIGAKEKSDLAGMMKQEQVNLQLMANKANSRWVEKLATTTREDGSKAGWVSPTVLDHNALRAGGIDVQMYQKMAGTLLAESKVAIMLTYLGEDQPLSIDKYTGAEQVVPALQCDPWKAVQQLFPHKLPSSSYMSGLTLLDRRILQTVIDVEKQGGAPGLAGLTLLLAVDSVQTTWVAEQALAKAHWGLQPHQILIVSIARFPGMVWERSTKTFKLSYGDASSYMTAGSGYACLALGWPSHSFIMTPQGREYIAGSTLQLLAKRGVQYLYSSLLQDMECLTPNCPALDPALVGPAVYAMDLKGANMAMQVVTSNNDQVARSANSIVLSPDPGQMYSCSIPMTDMQSVSTRPLLNSQVQSGNMVSCASRFFIQLRHLQSILTGPNAFHMKAEVNVPCLYVALDASDLTSHPASKCVAVLGKARAPPVHVKAFSRDWVRDAIPCLAAQDSQQAMRVRVAKLAAAAKASAGSTVSGMTVAVETIEREPAPGGSKFLMFVKDNNASRLAYKLLLSFLGPQDTLQITTVVSADHTASSGDQLLGSFTDVIADSRTRRKAIVQRDKLVDTMVAELETCCPDLIVLGSELLSTQTDSKTTSKQGAALGGSTPSITTSLLKSVTDVPFLVVKTNSAGELLHDSLGAAGAKKVALEVTNSSLPLLKWLGARMNADKDRLLLVRPHGMDPATGQESTVTQRMNQAFLTEAQAFRFTGYTAKRMPMAEGPEEGFPALVSREKVDLLALIAPSAKLTPPHILNLLKTARTSVLVWRQRNETAR